MRKPRVSLYKPDPEIRVVYEVSGGLDVATEQELRMKLSEAASLYVQLQDALRQAGWLEEGCGCDGGW